MLPSLRQIIAAFFGGFILASAGLHFAGVSRAAHETLPPPKLASGRSDLQTVALVASDRELAGTPLPVLFGLRFSADLTAIAATPARLTVPADNTEQRPAFAPAPERMPEPQPQDTPEPIPTPRVEVAALPPPANVLSDEVALPSPADADIVALLEPSVTAALPDDLITSVAIDPPDRSVMPTEPPAITVLLPALPLPAPARINGELTDTPNVTVQHRKARYIRRAKVAAKAAAPASPWSSWFGSKPQ